MLDARYLKLRFVRDRIFLLRSDITKNAREAKEGRAHSPFSRRQIMQVVRVIAL